MSKIFIDTNILVYSLDQFDPHKQHRSRELLRNLVRQDRGVISTQVLQEFYVTTTKKLDVDPLLAKDIIHHFERFEVVILSPQAIKDAIDCSILSRISFWDALIVVAAEYANCVKIWTEDLNDGQIIRGIRIENPLITGA